MARVVSNTFLQSLFFNSLPLLIFPWVFSRGLSWFSIGFPADNLGNVGSFSILPLLSLFSLSPLRSVSVLPRLFVSPPAVLLHISLVFFFSFSWSFLLLLLLSYFLLGYAPVAPSLSNSSISFISTFSNFSNSSNFSLFETACVSSFYIYYLTIAIDIWRTKAM